MAKQKVVHLHFKKPSETDAEDYFFGSIKAIYDSLSEARVGIKYKSLTNALRDTDTYENKMCVIKTGTLITKRQTNKSKSE